MIATARLAAALVVALVVSVSCAAPAAQSPAPRAASPSPAPVFALSRPVELVVQAAAGGGSDIFARKIADVLTKEKIVTQPVTVVNKPGGSGAVAYTYLAQKKADPHFIATATVSYLSTPLQQSAGYTYTELTNLVTLAVDDFIGVVRVDGPYKSLGDLVSAARAKPKEVKVGGTQVGSSDSIIPALVEQTAGVKFNYITFKSGAEVNAALLGGTVDWAVANPGEALSLIEGKKLRAVAAFAPVRLKGFDAPTAKEQGIDVTWEQFRGIVAPGGLTEEQRAFWEKALVQVTKSADWEKYLDENTLRPLVQTGPAAQQYLDRENGRLKQVLTALGLIK